MPNFPSPPAVPKPAVGAPPSLADQVYQQVRAAIIQDRYEPGAPLVIAEIAAQAGTSPGPVREALHRLERDGLVERHTRSAARVTPLSTREIFELFSVRSLIEGSAVRYALPHVGPEQRAELEALVEAMRAEGRARNLYALTDADMAFHRRLCEWSDSPVLLSAWLPLYSQIQRFIVRYHGALYPDLVALADTHLPILAALGEGCPDAAAQAVQAHIMLTWNSYQSSGKPSLG
ncbi:MAG: GntR family transcriptional regulator [Anaerolineae bacterium]|nr:GntR family transcriptional regulator [Anaerolineae bacterium]